MQEDLCYTNLTAGELAKLRHDILNKLSQKMSLVLVIKVLFISFFDTFVSYCFSFFLFYFSDFFLKFETKPLSPM